MSPTFTAVSLSFLSPNVGAASVSGQDTNGSSFTLLDVMRALRCTCPAKYTVDTKARTTNACNEDHAATRLGAWMSGEP